jgi:DNA primase
MRPDMESENAYYKRALQHSIYGEPGRKYLESRGLTEKTIDKWEIGWSPIGCKPTCFKSWEDDFKPWTKMWGGITFPIRDQNGNIVSISRRLVIPNKNKPKYDHYPFNARKVLFGLYHNKEQIQKVDRAIVTEGQIDVISSWQNELQIVVSSFGAHCSLDHFALLSRYATIVDILYDEDAAGKKGTDAIKKLSVFGSNTVNFRRGLFPQGDDLDSWIRKHSAQELLQLIDEGEVYLLKKRLAAMKSR